MAQIDTTPTLAYASGFHPREEVQQAAASAAVRAGELLVAFHGTTLPQCCVLCGNQGAPKPIKLTFTWDASFAITRDPSLQLRQQGDIHAYLCDSHRARWASARFFGGVGVAVAALLMVGGVGLAVFSETSPMPFWTPLGLGITVAGFAALILALFFFTLRSRTLSCQKIQEGYLYLEGASPRFLALLAAAQPPAQ